MKYKICNFCNTPHILSAKKCMYCKGDFYPPLKVKFWRWLLQDDRIRNVIKVKSWFPLSVIIDNPERCTVTPYWSWVNIRNLFPKLNKQKGKDDDE